MKIDMYNGGDIENCLICADQGKQTPVAVWTAYVLKITPEGAFGVTAGSCREHDKEFMALPHLDALTDRKFCVGLWKPEYGQKGHK